MPVASCVATGTACGRHSVSSLLSMPVASCVATGTACGRHPVASLLSMREGFPLKLPFTSLLFLPVSPNGAQAFFASTILAQRSDLREPVRCGPVPIRQAVVPAARSACMDTPPSRGPTGHSHCILYRPRLPCSPGPPAATHDDSPAARRRDRHTQPDKRIGEGGADRMVAARPWPSGTAMLREKERNASKRSFSPLPPARKRHEFF